MRFAPHGDPMITNDGKMLAPEGSSPKDFDLTVPLANKYQPKTRRAARDLPADAQTQTVLNSVLLYKLLGVSDNEVSVLLNCEIDDVTHIKGLPAFQETFELLFHEILSVNSTSLQSRLASYANRAVENVMELADSEPEKRTDRDGNTTTYYPVPPIVKLKANQDILDRSGLSPDVLFGRANDEGNSLQIEILTEQDNRTQVNINMGKR